MADQVCLVNARLLERKIACGCPEFLHLQAGVLYSDSISRCVVTLFPPEVTFSYGLCDHWLSSGHRGVPLDMNVEPEPRLNYVAFRGRHLLVDRALSLGLRASRS